MPQRIQRKRTKGWKMPLNTVYVGRPTKWGNPFWHTQRFFGIEAALRLFKNMANGIWNPTAIKDIPDPPAQAYYRDACDWKARLGCHPVEAIRAELRGKDLACWCPLDQPCHADVLLGIANGAEE